jgi:hypothetical protein
MDTNDQIHDERRQFHLQATRTLIDELTQPTIVKVETIDQNGTKKHQIVNQVSLLEQLQTAIASTNTGTPRGVVSAETRNVLDLSALILYQQIEQELNGLKTRTGDKTPPKDTLQNTLRSWQVHFHLWSDQHPQLPLHPYVKTISGWAATIKYKLDPPVTLEVTRPCPNCEKEYVYDEYDDKHRCLVVIWRRTFNESRAECRACGQTWVGERELRNLRWGIDQKDGDTP